MTVESCLNCSARTCSVMLRKTRDLSIWGFLSHSHVVLFRFVFRYIGWRTDSGSMAATKTVKHCSSISLCQPLYRWFI